MCPRLLPLLLLALAAAGAAEHRVPLRQEDIDGEAMGIKPGDVVLIEAGPRPFLRIRNVQGTAGAAVTLRNEGGVVELSNNTHHYNIRIGRSRFVRIIGDGVPGLRYGFHLKGTNQDGSGVMAGELSSDLEIAHLHIERSGFAGMLVKTDGATGTFMDNIEIHDNYIHDTGGEGLYLGETKTPGQHFRHVRIWNNVIVRTGWEACQLANATEDVRVHHNVFARAGLAGIKWQNRNFQLGANTTARVSENLFLGSRCTIATCFGGQEKEFRNNYFEGFEETEAAAYYGDTNTSGIPPTGIEWVGNVFRGLKPELPVFLFQATKSRISVSNNVVEGENEFVKFIGRRPPGVTITGNLRKKQIPRPRFLDEAHDDFRLPEDDPYRKRGIGLLP